MIKSNDIFLFTVYSKSHRSTHKTFVAAAGTAEALKFRGETVWLDVKALSPDGLSAYGATVFVYCNKTNTRKSIHPWLNKKLMEIGA